MVMDLQTLTNCLVSKSNPNVYNTSGDGLSDAWDVLLGLSPLVNQFAQPPRARITPTIRRIGWKVYPGIEPAR